jgi:uncharacterized RDD family membrane protein YckC
LIGFRLLSAGDKLEKPDFSKYSESQLRQILTRIDKERFPDRVAEIHALLARMEAERPARIEIRETVPDVGPARIAGFWRRAGAFMIDALLLALLGHLLGLFLRDQFEALDAWGRALGLVIAFAYFGTMESSVFQGRTFGKHALGIKVVAADGTPLAFGKALLRSAIFCIPYFLNNVNVGSASGNIVFATIQSLLVFGLGGAIVYLCLFNRRTRQSVHDLLLNAAVVRAETTNAPDLQPVWKGDLAVIGILFALATGVVIYGYSAVAHGALEPLMRVQQQVRTLTGVHSAGVFRGTSYLPGDRRVEYLSVNAVTNVDTGAEWALARRIADTTFATYPAALELETFSVTLMHGYDIGIASSWSTRTYNASPDAWRDGSVPHD